MAADGWGGYSAHAVGQCSAYARGAPVLKWAGPRIREDKALVEFLAWANPSNLCFASPALQADAEVVAAALASPFYAEPPPPVPPSCVLRFADERLRASKEVVLSAIARSGYELEFAEEALRADPYVVAWAGAPVGAANTRGLSATLMRLLKSDISVAYMDANWKSLLKDLNFNNLDQIVGQWPDLPMSRPSFNGNSGDKHSVCALLKRNLEARCPLCLRLPPPVRELLWPTREQWDGRF